MRPYLILFLVTFSAAGCSINWLTKRGIYEELGPSEYLNYVQDSLINIIDVRTEGEYEKTHIDRALNVSYFSGHFRKVVDTIGLDKGIPLLIYCETQHRSLFAAKKLYKAGFNKIIDLDKGMMNWRKNEFPYYSNTTQSTK